MIRAVLVLIGFGLCGVIGWVLIPHNWEIILGILIFLYIIKVRFAWAFFNQGNDFDKGYAWAKTAISENDKSPAYIEAQLFNPNDPFENGARAYLREIYEAQEKV